MFGVPAMSNELRTEIALFTTQPRSVDAQTEEALERSADDAQLQAAPSLGDRPLIVLAAEQNMKETPNWPEAQKGMAALSTKGRLIVATGSGHYIHMDQPALVIDAVRQVVTEVRGH
jgi:pimeloyl-ACP methyl ester carboxylesterase